MPDSSFPEGEKDPCIYPHLKPIVRRRMGTQLCLIQRLPLAARSQNVEDSIGTGTIRHARPSSAKAMGIDVDGQQRLKHGPEIIRDPRSSSRMVIGRALSRSRLVIVFAHSEGASYLGRMGKADKGRGA